MKPILRALAALSAVVAVGAASASLVPYAGGRLVYDTDRDLTWAANANLCVALDNCVNGDAGGGMLWHDAKQWAAALDYLGYTDWRLASAIGLAGPDPCQGFNCTDSEIGHLFYTELGGVALQPTLGDQGPFQDIQARRYWLDTPYAPVPGVAAWTFDFGYGIQGIEAFGGADDSLAAWAVRSGRPLDVPEPATLALVGAALLGVAATRRRKTAAPTA